MIPVNDLSRGFKLYQDEYEEAALRVLRSGWYVLGHEVEDFEKEFAASLGEECYCVGVANGLDAIMLGLLAAGIGEGDEVIVQANGYIATMLGVMQCKATPVYVEPDEYYQLDAANIEDAITDKTKAVIVTHLYGQATRMDEIVRVCDKRGLLLFEDCAQSHYAPLQRKEYRIVWEGGILQLLSHQESGRIRRRRCRGLKRSRNNQKG